MPWQQRGFGVTMFAAANLLHRLVGVGAHLLDPVPAHDGPEHGGPGLGDGSCGP